MRHTVYMTQILYLFFCDKKIHFIFTRILSDIWLSGSVMTDQREQEVSIGMVSDRVMDQTQET